MNNNIVKNISYFTVGRIFITGLQALFSFLIAYLVEPEIFGEISFLIALAGTVSVFSRFGFTHTVIVSNAKSKTKFSHQVNLLAGIMLSVGSLFLIPINVFAAIFCFGFSLYQMNQFNLIGSKEYKKFMHTAILKGILIVFLPISLYFVLDIGGVLLGMAIGNMIASTNYIRSIYIRSIFQKFEGFSEIRKNFKSIYQNFLVDVAPNLVRFVDKLVIVPFFGFAFAGIYQFNFQILLLMEILPQGIHAFFLSEESSQKVNPKIYYLLVVVTGILLIIALLFSPIVIETFFPKYSQGIFSLQILLISIIPITFASILNAKMQSYASTKVGFAAPFRIGILLLLIPLLGIQYGLEGLSYSILISSIFYTIILYIIYNIDNKK